MSDDPAPAARSLDRVPTAPDNEDAVAGPEPVSNLDQGGGDRRIVSTLMRVARSRWTRILFVVAAVALLSVALVHQGPTLRREAETLSAPVIVAAFAAGLAGLACSLLVWRAVLADLGSRLSLGDACRIMFIGQL